jgi:hypothetical protein
MMIGWNMLAMIIGESAMEMEFPTKQSYLDWRAEMRADYTALSKLLRELKGNITLTARTSAKNVSAEKALAAAEARKAKWRSKLISTAGMQHAQIFLRKKATTIMTDRRDAKVIAIASWTKWRETNQPPSS